MDVHKRPSHSRMFGKNQQQQTNKQQQSSSSSLIPKLYGRIAKLLIAGGLGYYILGGYSSDGSDGSLEEIRVDKAPDDAPEADVTNITNQPV
eukprot:CAMPEP_0119004138 /NCGR_PEP_ID=MMETSP1176-20130426/976_1 /TAXON_ID=265551 /ORGANISM="Synedropsis recta cf, Strain CCMP1620" /LENGTH=91 /DNA_ID=CAMNT_0006955815 /DNA_START=105 /DNA_END=380 /DNA_ORIENTATION=+